MPEFKEPTPKNPLERGMDTLFTFYKKGKQLVDAFDRKIDPIKEEDSLGERSQIFSKELVPLIITLSAELLKNNELRSDLESRMKDSTLSGKNPENIKATLEKLAITERKIREAVERESDIYNIVNEFLVAKSESDVVGVPFAQKLGDLMQTINFLKGIVYRSGELNNQLFDIKKSS
jgi:hypothetical protein